MYLDNAATTPIEPEVADLMYDLLKNEFGNPSSTHSFGRKVKGSLEQSRRKIAQLIGAEPGEIIFTSGGTEADNMAIKCSIADLGMERIISSRIEHHAVLYTIEHCREQHKVDTDTVKLDEKGFPDLNHLEELLSSDNRKTLVSLMHGNNEIGNLISLQEVGELCKKYRAVFHSDTVQTMGHYDFDMKKLPVDFITGGAHKFHGPKGVGFLYTSKGLNLKPMIIGGGQEAGKRAGTENIYGIAGMAKALEIACEHSEDHRRHVTEIKKFAVEQIKKRLPGARFNGASADLDRSLYTVLNVQLPETDKGEMLLFSLDIQGVAVSGGSACTSGSNEGSHVLRGIGADMSRPSIRLSFSRFNTKDDVTFALDKIVKLYE